MASVIKEVAAISIEDVDSEVTFINKGNQKNEEEYRYVELDPKRYYSSALDNTFPGAASRNMGMLGDKLNTTKENNRLSQMNNYMKINESSNSLHPSQRN